MGDRIPPCRTPHRMGEHIAYNAVPLYRGTHLAIPVMQNTYDKGITEFIGTRRSIAADDTV